MRAIWPDTFVVDANLANLVGEVRTALGDSTHEPRFVRTVHRFGYAFIEADRPASRRTGRRGTWQARWNDQRIDLPPGIHVIGRGDHGIRIDSRRVSRVHAQVVVSPAGLTYEDLASKNGSFRDDERIEGVVEVESGDVITVGTVDVTFVRAGRTSSTQSVERRAVRLRGGDTRIRRR